MKKTVLLSLLILSSYFLLPVRAQFVVGLYLNGSKPNYSSTMDMNTTYHRYNYEYITQGPGGESVGPFVGYTDSLVANKQYEYEDDAFFSVGGGLKIGYQWQGIQFGVSGTFNYFHTHADQDAARYMAANPNCDVNVLKTQSRLTDTMILNDYEGWFDEHYTSFSVSPYVRFELIQSGDIALFAEINGFYTKINKPKHHDYLDWYHHEMHHTIDTNYIVDNTTTSYGALVTPGLSWQLTPNCLLDLYFDFLAMGYRYTKSIDINVVDEYDYTASPRVLARRTTTTTVAEDTNIGFDLNAAPMSARNYSTWVRVGFSYTF